MKAGVQPLARSSLIQLCCNLLSFGFLYAAVAFTTAWRLFDVGEWEAVCVCAFVFGVCKAGTCIICSRGTDTTHGVIVNSQNQSKLHVSTWRCQRGWREHATETVQTGEMPLCWVANCAIWKSVAGHPSGSKRKWTSHFWAACPWICSHSSSNSRVAQEVCCGLQCVPGSHPGLESKTGVKLQTRKFSVHVACHHILPLLLYGRILFLLHHCLKEFDDNVHHAASTASAAVDKRVSNSPGLFTDDELPENWMHIRHDSWAEKW